MVRAASSSINHLIYCRIVQLDKGKLALLNLLDEFNVAIRGCKLVTHKT